MGTETAPQRIDVEQVWMGMIAGRTTRESAHNWAARWVEGGELEPPEMMVMRGLQYIHGYDVLPKSDVEMRQDFERWKEDCVSYDRDPDGWVQAHRDIARRAVAEERDRKRRRSRITRLD